MPDTPQLPASPLSAEADADLAQALVRWRRSLLALSLGLVGVGLWAEANVVHQMLGMRAQMVPPAGPRAHEIAGAAVLYGTPLLLGVLGLTTAIASGPRPSAWAPMLSVTGRAIAAAGTVGYWVLLGGATSGSSDTAAGAAGLMGWALVLALPRGSRWRPAKLLRAASVAGATAPVVAVDAFIAYVMTTQPAGVGITAPAILSAAALLLAPLAFAGLLLWLIIREPQPSSE